MSLTSVQKKDLKALSGKLREFEKNALENNIDLDVFMTEYGDDGVRIYATEKISQQESAGKRRKVFEKHNSEQKKSSVRHD